MEIKRTLSADLYQHLAQKEITLVIGPRQAGKTTLVQALMDRLENEGKRCFFFNVDIDTDAQHFTTQQQFLNRLNLLSGGQPAFVFIDEVQRIENAGLFLKGLYDRNLPYKLIATGSGSLELKEKIAESLVGRKRNFFLYTVSITEFIRYKTSYQYGDRLSLLLAGDPILAEQLLDEYLRFGGYPRVITAGPLEEKNALLSEIFQGYIEKDIRLLLQLEKSKAFVTLLRLLANRTGQLTNYSDLANLTGLSVATVKNYLWYSEKTFITAAVTPFFRNKEKEVVKAPQYYFLDAGLRNFLLGIKDIHARPSDFGFLFQQLIFRILEEKYRFSAASVHYWRTQNKAEVDFVIDHGAKVIPVEAKSTNLTKTSVSRSLRSFLEEYDPEEAWIVNRSLETTIQIGRTQVRFIPWFKLVFEEPK